GRYVGEKPRQSTTGSGRGIERTTYGTLELSSRAGDSGWAVVTAALPPRSRRHRSLGAKSEQQRSTAMVTVRLARMAMACRFELILYGEDAVRLRAAGEAALDEIERIEARLTIYDAASD